LLQTVRGTCTCCTTGVLEMTRPVRSWAWALAPRAASTATVVMEMVFCMMSLDGLRPIPAV
jgi:hypothetical protein